MSKEFRELPKESRLGDAQTADFGDHVLDVYKLIDLAKDLDVLEIDIPPVENFKDDACWNDENGKKLKPYEIVQEYINKPDIYSIIEKHPEWRKHIEKIMEANYEDIPIILIDDQVMDGMHRLTRAWIDGVEKVKAKKFEHLSEEKLKQLEYEKAKE